MAKIALFLGSMRPKSNSANAAQVLINELLSQGAVTDLVDPRVLDLRIPGGHDSEPFVSQLTASLQARVAAADGVVLVTPEYDGSYSAVMKLLLEHLGYPSRLQGKPVALLGVASGQIGAARAVDHLRGVAMHVGALVVPGAVSVAAIHRGFDPMGRVVDERVATDIRSVATNLLDFLRRFRPGS